ncbi:MAG: hypothetical protein HDS70_08675 [Bacteroidales bacterium]|nr:hypothetical protein [Bacteroidales bacterium]
MAKFHTQYSSPPVDLEIAVSDSETVPDMSFSVQEIIKRFTRGTLEPSQLERPTYYDDISDDQIDNVISPPRDLTEYEDCIRNGDHVIDSLLREKEIQSNTPLSENLNSHSENEVESNSE